MGHIYKLRHGNAFVELLRQNVKNAYNSMPIRIDLCNRYIIADSAAWIVPTLEVMITTMLLDAT